jgi:hypothetical protein
MKLSVLVGDGGLPRDEIHTMFEANRGACGHVGHGVDLRSRYISLTPLEKALKGSRDV